jgi:hypothetical protein
MDEDIFLLDGEAAPLVLLTSMVSKKSVSNPEYKWMEDERIPTLSAVNGAFSSTATDLLVDAGGYFREDGLAKIQRTGEVVLIGTVSTNTLSVTRSYGGTDAAAILDNDSIISLGSVFAEGSTSPDPKTTKKVSAYNYTEIVRNSIEFTETQLASDLYGPADLAYQQRKCGVEHAIDIENKLWFGERVEAGVGTGIRRSTGGLDEIISTNDSNFGGIFNMVTFFGFAEDLFRYGSGSKVMFAAPSVVSNISLEAINYLEIMRKEDTFGLDIKKLLTPHGSLMIVKHNLFEGATYGKRAYVVDLDAVGYRFLKGRDTKLHTAIQANDKDSRKDEYRTEMGFVRKSEKVHGRITNAA